EHRRRTLAVCEPAGERAGSALHGRTLRSTQSPRAAAGGKLPRRARTRPSTVAGHFGSHWSAPGPNPFLMQLDPGQSFPGLRDPAGKLRCLSDPARHELLVEPVVLVNVEVARVLVLGRDGRDRTQRRAAEERHLDVPREAMDAEEPALALDAVQRRVPFDRLAHAGDGAHDERIEAAPDVAFPARHGRDVGLHGGVALRFGDLRVAAREEGRLRRRGGTLALPVQRNGGRIRSSSAASSTCSPSRMSMARRTFPSRLALNRPDGSSSDAPLAKVILTTFLWASPVQTRPSCDQTGVAHFHSSTISGSAALMIARTRWRVSPRQSASSLILRSISLDADSTLPLVAAEPSRLPAALLDLVAAGFLSAIARMPRLREPVDGA